MLCCGLRNEDCLWFLNGLSVAQPQVSFICTNMTNIHPVSSDFGQGGLFQGEDLKSVHLCYVQQDKSEFKGVFVIKSL